jgi:hypothetical protein
MNRLIPVLLMVAFLVLVLLPLSCVDSFEHKLDEHVNLVVIEGTITNLAEPQVIRLNRSKSDSLTGLFGTLPITGATVEIIVDSAEVVLLKETNAGRYQAPNGFAGKIGHAYQLRCTLREGTRYRSNHEVMAFVPPIRKVSAVFNPASLPARLYNGTFNQYRGAHDLSVDWQDPADQHNYYRWEWSLWEKQDWCHTCVQGFYVIYHPYDNTRLLEDCVSYTLNAENSTDSYFVNDYNCRTKCWEIIPSRDINVFDDQLSNGGQIQGRRVAQIPYYQYTGSLFELRQLSLSKKAYSYFKLFQDQTQNSGGLADTPPSAPVGNMRNDANGQERVVGYFTASAVSSVRYWLDRKDATGLPIGLFEALNGLHPSPEGEIDPNTQKGKRSINNIYVSPINTNRVPRAVCVPSDSRTPVKPEGWRD